MSADSIEKIADLLPCPFCGRPASWMPDLNETVRWPWCTACDIGRDTAEEWNTRALPSAELERDAARYRYIRSGECHIHSIWFQSFGERFNLMESDLDDSVDAAIARAKEAPR